jgi:hypothetical protein
MFYIVNYWSSELICPIEYIMGSFYLCYCKFDYSIRIAAELLLDYTGLRFKIFC